MTIRDALIDGAKTLSRRHRDAWSSAALDAELLLAHALKTSREEIYAHRDRRIGAPTARRFRGYIQRRLQHEPVAYITGHKEFFDLDFLVKKKCTLIPRPETETLVERAIYVLHTTYCALVLDVGTGSGAIAVAVAKNVPAVKIIATDNSADALRLARQNARAHGVSKKIKFLRTDLLSPYSLSTNHYPLILANLPYLPTAEWRATTPEIRRYEPRAALDGGPDGLTLYRRLFDQIAERGLAHFTLLAEIHPEQAKPFSKKVRARYPSAKISFHHDLAGKIRVIEMEA